MPKRSLLFYTVQLLVVTLVLIGILPREAGLVWTAVLIIYMVKAPTSEGVLFFIASIPLFLALPLSDSFDNFNAWRIILIVVFIKWLWLEGIDLWKQNIQSFFKAPIAYLKAHPGLLAAKVLGLIAVASLLVATDVGAGMKRIIYFANISLLGILVYYVAQRQKDFISKAIRAIRIPTVLVIIVGFIQIISTYLIDVYQFMQLWGERIQCNQFGMEWCTIAVQKGNTWLAYYGDQLSLRVFSLFPDSHSFPQFVLLGIPAVLALGISNIPRERMERFWTLARTRGRFSILFVPAGFLIAILSGTRGIWAASLAVLIIAAFIHFLLARMHANAFHKTIFRYVTSYLILFFMLFAVAYPIFTSPQFLLSKGNLGLFGNRIRSIIDFGETSNSLRIEIWKKSLESISERPLLGVGIGNFPVVLGQDIFLARAGSSAHNIYLHIAAEMGIGALLIVLAMIIRFALQLYQKFIQEADPTRALYWAGLMLTLPWVLVYSLTDVALFDERSFLLFVATLGLIASHD